MIGTEGLLRKVKHILDFDAKCKQLFWLNLGTLQNMHDLSIIRVRWKKSGCLMLMHSPENMNSIKFLVDYSLFSCLDVFFI